MGKIVLFGELMLRLKSAGKERLFQSPALEAVFGGSEANVAVSLSIFGKNAVYVTALPDNYIGKSAESSLRYYGVNTMPLYKPGRLGIYYLEDGACQRPSQVIYDRSNSVVSLAEPDEYNWKDIFKDAKWFHVSGVTPAISLQAFECTLRAMQEAKKLGVTVSLDLNYRKKLWNYGKTASDAMRELSTYADVLIANEEDVQNCLGIPLQNYPTPQESYRHLCMDVKKQFTNARYVAITLRQSYSADHNGWSCVLDGQHGFYESAHYDIESIVERVGAGDSFVAGLIYGLTEFESDKYGEQKALDFAAASSCLKHSIPGDFNLATLDQVMILMNGNSTGRIQR